MKPKLLKRDDVLKFTGVDDRTNLKWILVDYLTLALIVVPAAFFFENRAAWGFPVYWNIPVVMAAVLLVGAVQQHRLACLGHEAAHYTLLNNRFWNEVVSDLFCIYPLFATTQAYRVHHIGHHLYPNDWEKDPNLLNGGQTKHFDRFPMEKKNFVYLYYLRFFWPPYLLRHLWDIFYVNALGSGIAPVPVEHDDENPDKLELHMRPATALGILYLTGLCAAMYMATTAARLICCWPRQSSCRRQSWRLSCSRKTPL